LRESRKAASGKKMPGRAGHFPESLFEKFCFPGVPGALPHEVTLRRTGIVAENLAKIPAQQRTVSRRAASGERPGCAP
jgi:hypothetical protein